MHFDKIATEERPSTASDIPTIYEVGDDAYIFCPVRRKPYKVTGKPEELVRQWWLYRLHVEYGYPFDQMAIEVPVSVGSGEAKKAADIVIYTDNKKKTPRIFVEVRKPNRKDGIEQLQVYMNATGCRIGLWSNGTPPHVYLLRLEPNEHSEEATWRELRNIPRKSEKISDVDSPITRAELEPVQDFLSLFRECEDFIKAHEGADAFDEIFKLVFSKLYDERRNLKNDQSRAQFRVGAFESAADARTRIVSLFDSAKNHWAGVFEASDALNLGDETLAYCVSALQKAYLLRSDADALGAAFEVMINPGMKGDKGQYFTPRHVVQMCIDVLNPRDNESIFDPACGSGGFLIYTMDKVFKDIASDRDDQSEILENQKDYASTYVFGMDYDRTLAKVAKAYMLIWGDGRSNIAVADGLNENYWDQATQAKFMVGAGKERKPRGFDIIATNPPFAGDIKAEDTLSKYEIAYKIKGNKRKRLSQVSRDKLFIERCISLLNPNGRMAIVLPRGVLKNYNDENIRRHIITHCRIVAVVGLTGDMFKPYTNTKTCVLFVQKRPQKLDDIALAEADPDIVFAQTTQSGKDRSGRLVRNAEGVIASDLPEISEFIKANVEWA
ncbi:N-6 DNA methylase [uncultured Devosia sp.]|uniref:restriction endonuclease subunit M n=1 Tax=uncultured Devosia sp. TaxID=211434 RepID=UPI0026357F9B|nr:N-6 DNA methylase [uncultured Devosia sp.]